MRIRFVAWGPLLVAGCTGERSPAETFPGCLDADRDGYGVGVDCRGTDCDDGDEAVWTAETCDARCARGDHATGCACDRSRYPEPEPCFTSDPTEVGVGSCRAGIRSCVPRGVWSDCAGEIAPSAEICDLADNDCDGEVDEGVQSECGGCDPRCKPEPPVGAGNPPVVACTGDPDAGPECGLPPSECADEWLVYYTNGRCEDGLCRWDEDYEYCWDGCWDGGCSAGFT